MSCGIGCRYSSDPLFLWHRPAATAPTPSLAWEPPYATGAALKSKKKKKQKKTKQTIFSICVDGIQSVDKDHCLRLGEIKVLIY